MTLRSMRLLCLTTLWLGCTFDEQGGPVRLVDGAPIDASIADRVVLDDRPQEDAVVPDASDAAPDAPQDGGGLQICGGAGLACCLIAPACGAELVCTGLLCERCGGHADQGSREEPCCRRAGDEFCNDGFECRNGQCRRRNGGGSDG